MTAWTDPPTLVGQHVILRPTVPEERANPVLDLAADLLDRIDDPGAELTAAVLRIHAQRAVTAAREVRLLKRFTGAHPRVPIVGVPSLPFEVSDLAALRAVADQLTRRG